jgi:hypothetical protein
MLVTLDAETFSHAPACKEIGEVVELNVDGAAVVEFSYAMVPVPLVACSVSVIATSA